MAETKHIRRWFRLRRGEKKPIAISYRKWNAATGETITSASGSSSDTSAVQVPASLTVNNAEEQKFGRTHPAGTLVTAVAEVPGNAKAGDYRIDVTIEWSNTEHVDIEPVGIRIVG